MRFIIYFWHKALLSRKQSRYWLCCSVLPTFFCVCYHTLHFLYHVCLIDGVASIIIFLLHEDVRSCNFLMSGSIFILPPYAEREKKPSEYGDFCMCRRRESNPGRQHSKQTRYPLHHCPLAFFVYI